MFLNATNIIYDFFEEIDKKSLNEAHGVLLNYSDYIFEVYNELIKIKPVLVDSNIYKYSLKDYHLNIEGSFIDNVSIDLFLYINKRPDNSSEYVVNENNESDLTKDLKLKDANFILRMTSKDVNIDREEFRNVFVHELHHAYRYWSLLTKNNNTIPDGEQYRNRRYKDIFIRKSILTNNTKAERILDEILGCLYFLDENEINSFCAETYDYIKNNENINISNYYTKLNDLQMYKYIHRCSNILSDLDEMLFNENTKQYIEAICKDAYDTIFGKNKFSENKCTILLRQYISKKILRANKQFSKTIRNALNDFNRNIKENTYFSGPRIEISDELLNNWRIL